MPGPEEGGDVTTRRTAGRVLQTIATRLQLEPLDALAQLLGSVPRASLEKVVPAAFLHDKLLASKKEFAQKIEEKWTMALCLGLKMRNLLSRRKWQSLRACLSSEWSEEEGKFVLMTVDGVGFPRLPPHHQLRAFQYLLAKQYGVVVDEAGLTAYMDLEMAITRDLIYNLGLGHFTVEADGRLRGKDGRDPVVQWKVDAANMHAGVKQSSGALTLPLHCTSPNSPGDHSQIVVTEFGDHWQEMVTNIGPVIDGVNQVANNPIFTLKEEVDGRPLWTKIKVICGGDMSFIVSMLTISGCNGPCPCPYCEIGKKDCCSTDDSFLSAQQRRTLDRINLLTHSALGECPGCGVQIVDDVTGENQMLRASPGDDEPTKKTFSEKLKKSKKTWLQGHFGCVYGRYVPIHVEIMHWILCLLHCGLRIVGALLEHTVLDHIGTCVAVGQDQAAELKKIFAGISVVIKDKKLAKRPTNLDKAWTGNFSCGGADAEKITYVADSLLGVVFPKTVRDRDDEVRRKFEKCTAAWANWRSLWALLATDLEDTEAARQTHARLVKAQSRIFVDAFVKAHKKTQGLYLHLISAHLHEFVLEWGDLRPFQAQGLEHCHSLRKQAARAMTNKKKGQRISQMMDFLVGTDYNQKTVQHNLDQKAHARNKLAQQKRALRKVVKMEKMLEGVTTTLGQ